eukprot:GEMP01020005.1.p1 GENE.GEMP01020005.1~~GEMP01020005.1.p1  ORF type:complete len:490 (+),score=97.29 GEMP01020005.1:698-2167(+)
MNYVHEYKHLGPVDTLQLSVLWPRFPFGQKIDNAVFSELDPIEAPQWQIRMVPREKIKTPLRDSINEAWKYRLEASTAGQESSTFSAALSTTLEALLMPDAEEMNDMLRLVFGDHEVRKTTLLPSINSLKGAPLSSPFSRFCSIASKLKCYRAVVTFWRNFLWRLRDCQVSELGEVTRGPDVGLQMFGRRAKIADFNQCIVQQKIELIRQCLDPPAEELPQPPFVTEDILQVHQWTQEQLSKECRERALAKAFGADVQAYRIKHREASFDSFAEWYISRKYAHPEQRALLQITWDDPSSPAELFNREKEVEMAFHFLDNLSPEQLFAEFFVTYFQTEMREWVADHNEQFQAYPYLRSLLDTLDAKIKAVWDVMPPSSPCVGPIWQGCRLPTEKEFRSILVALSALEEKMVLARELEKTIVRDVVGPLVEHNIALVPVHYRPAVDNGFQPSITKSRPLVKEFIFLSKRPGHRLFADVRKDSVRLASSRLL